MDAADDDDDEGAEFEVKVALKVKDGAPVLKSGKGRAMSAWRRLTSSLVCRTYRSVMSRP